MNWNCILVFSLRKEAWQWEQVRPSKQRHVPLTQRPPCSAQGNPFTVQSPPPISADNAIIMMAARARTRARIRDKGIKRSQKDGNNIKE